MKESLASLLILPILYMLGLDAKMFIVATIVLLILIIIAYLKNDKPKESKELKYMKNQVLILTGPAGSGKTTIAELLVKNKDFVLLDSDHEDTEFFPNGNQWLPKNHQKLSQAHDKILKKAKDIFASGKSVVVDYIIFNQFSEFIDKFKKEFKDNLEIKVLFPDKNIMIKRDKERECWTAGEKAINEIYNKLEAVKSEIGVDNYIDTSDEAPEETIKKHF
jgi:adenylate kinase family enzyme